VSGAGGGESGDAQPHRRRPRYAGRYPRRFEEKYKERDPAKHSETVAKVMASGKTPAGTHRPIMVAEILDVLDPKPGDVFVDCTLGYGGHAEALIPRLIPVGRLIGLDVDPIQLPRTDSRLRALGFGPESFVAVRTNFAALPRVLTEQGIGAVHGVLADLGVSSMQLDEPARGFSVKFEGPLDMRMNPNRGRSAAEFLRAIDAKSLQAVLQEFADEPHAVILSSAIAGGRFPTTTALAQTISGALPARVSPDEKDLSVRRVFQAIRIAVNDELSVLDTFLRHLPECLLPSGRAAILTFHSGEDRRVKKAFEAGARAGIFSSIADHPLRPSSEERHANPRSTSAKLRWAIRAG
jgi:16S rRNA (cytosine1402-N4)-methyltransferase